MQQNQFEEQIPIKNQQVPYQSQIPQQPISMLVNEKTRLPESNIYMNYSRIIGFQELEINQYLVEQQGPSQFPPSQYIQSQIAYQQSRPIPNPPQQQPQSVKLTYSDYKQTPQGRKPEMIQCKWCNHEGYSEVSFHIGLGTIVFGLLLSIFFIGFIFFFCRVSYIPILGLQRLCTLLQKLLMRDGNCKISRYEMLIIYQLTYTMLAPQYILTKFQEFLEIQLENKPNKNEVLKKLREFNRYFIANNYSINKGIEYLQGQSVTQINIPQIIIEKLKITETKMQITGYGLNGLYNSIMLGLSNKNGQFIADGISYSQLNELIKGNQITNNIGLWHFKEIATVLLKNSINLNLSNHLLENGIQISDQIDVNNLSIGQSALLIDNLKYVINVDIQQVLYYKPNNSLHRLVLLNSSLPNSIKVMIENDLKADSLQFSIFIEDQYYQEPKSLQYQVKYLLEEMNRQTEYLIEANQLSILSEFQTQTLTREMKNLILSEDKRKRCLKCQQEFSSDIGSIAGQITNFCMKCYKEFSI